MNTAAVEQIQQLASTSGPIQLHTVSEERGYTVLRVSLDTRGILHAPTGIRLRGREIFDIMVPPAFPFEAPSVWATHQRWAGTAHVQWGRSICIYAAPSVEWSPADGMRGLIDRLALWLERAAAGTLDPDGQPLHPPVAYPGVDAGHLVVRADLGDRVPWNSSGDATAVLFAGCVQVGADRADVVEWYTRDELFATLTTGAFTATDPQGRPRFVAVAGFISDQIAFEYPDKAQELLDALERSGLAAETLLSNLSLAQVVNEILQRQLSQSTLPNIVLLGTPARRIETARLAHLAAWQLEGIGDKVASLLGKADWGVLKQDRADIYDLVHQWLRVASIAWKRVWEDRPEVTRPRDTDTPTSRLRGKRVLLLGAGALGAPIAEHCVRARVSAITIVDNGRVNPGILSRQPYRDADISKRKANILAERLRMIRPDVIVTAEPRDAKHTFESVDQLDQYDLIIDATADIGVRSAIETRRAAGRSQWPPVLAMMVGHEATVGVVAASHREASGGPVDVLRRFSLTCLATPTLGDIAADFFPGKPRGDLFFPEPGCSSPTFVGSNADATALSGMLLSEGMTLLAASDAPMSATAVRRDSQTRPAVQTASWQSDTILEDANGSGYEVRLTAAALTEMRAEARRGRRVRGSRVETGGMLLGAIDEACKVIYVDRAAGPPPDSRLSAVYFQHGTFGTQEVIDERRAATQERQSFVGLWHTHPYGAAEPSATDDEGMWELVNLHGIGRRALMIIAGGPTAWDHWLQDATTPELYARISHIGARAQPSDSGSVRDAPADFFSGGFAYPARFHAHPGERS
ncbi:ThiF family adenylyltransferase [Curtobacterium sp. A7_M15]|uniref:ThiF family adenylyltransferase n=1 Tax=Curtobacterium sp. A7_M15 TaxID=3065241 RepID=UPI002737ADE6|nr:ThiF family adenylyltransferase [Curtobacterium sp. A7_M15]MDP4332083.1 ThiF family adenylyltransferase [Curtobacterium sp. A7_M15]